MWFDLTVSVFGHEYDLRGQLITALQTRAYRIKDTWDRCTSDNGGPDDTIWGSQVVEQDSRTACQLRAITPSTA
jgi:hypothetical protein